MGSGLKVIHVIDSLNPGGRERQLVELIQGLAAGSAIKNEVIVLSKNVYFTEIQKNGVPLTLFERTRKKDLKLFGRLYGKLRESRPDIVHTWSSMSAVYGIPVSKLIRTKTVNGMIRGAKSNITIGDERWLRSKITFPLSDHIVANSKAGLRAFSAPPAKSTCIYNGFDFNRIENLPSREYLKKEFGIKTDHVVGMVANFTAYKDYETFLSATLKLALQNRNVTIVAVGGGPYLKKYQAMASGEASRRIRFLGIRKDVDRIIKLFDVGVLCTNVKNGEEGISNAIMEYMAQEKPVVATNCGGNGELVQHARSGFLIESFNPEELLHRLTELLANSRLAHRMGQAGKARLMQHFSRDRMVEQFKNLYLQLYRA